MEPKECRTCRWWKLTGVATKIEDIPGICLHPLPLPMALSSNVSRAIQAGCIGCACWESIEAPVST